VLVPLIMIVVAAVVTTVVLVVNGSSAVSVRGTVVDSMNGTPVAAARITAEGHSATSGTDGGFTLGDIAKNAPVTVTATNYQSTEIAATKGAESVRLVPVPVHARVTSDMTSEPIGAMLTTPSGEQATTGENGTVEAYRVGPGDKVTVSASGYLAAEVAVGTDRTLTAALHPTWATASAQLLTWASAKQNDKIVNWVLTPATGFQYGSDPLMSFSIEGVWGDARAVVDKNVGVCLFVTQGGFPDGEISAFFNDKAQAVTLAGQKVWHGPMFEGAVGSLWSSPPLVIVTVGTNQADTDSVLAGIIAAQPIQ
jgi:hypothetical protein